MNESENFQVRDVFNPEAVAKLADDLQAAWRNFNAAAFQKQILAKLAVQTYSERKQAITDALSAHLPADFEQAVGILLQALPPPLEGEGLDVKDRFILVCLTAYVAKHGLHRERLDFSLQALYEMTKRFSAEFDIRHFIAAFPEPTLAVLHQWAKDSNMHVRRLVSEGSRPYLPWGKRLVQFDKDPMPALALLEHLRTDPEEYVRRSVANHLNDVAKKHPEKVVQLLKRWKAEVPSTTLDRLIRHATRTLVKQGHPEALALQGFSKGAEVAVEKLTITPSPVKLGENIQFSFQLDATGRDQQKLVVDYGIYFLKANGRHALKIFKLGVYELAPNAGLSITRNFSFRPITTRVYYPGLHKLIIQVNGVEMIQREFEVIA